MEPPALELTPQQRQLNYYWRLLAGVVGELSIALDVGDLTPEERLAKVRDIQTFVHARLGTTPRSLVAEMEARRPPGTPSVQEQLEDFYRQIEDDGRAKVYRMGEDGEMHEDFYVPSKGQIVALNDDDWSSASVLSEPAMAWLHAEAQRRREQLSEAEQLVYVESLSESGIIAELIEDLARRKPEEGGAIV